MKVDDSIKVIASGSLDGNRVSITKASADIREASTAFDGYKLDVLELQLKIESRKDIDEAIRMLEIHKHCFANDEKVGGKKLIYRDKSGGMFK